MPKKQIPGWSRLDNAAKIFPASTEKTETCVFRFYCELVEMVNPEFLQEALDKAIEEFPNFLCSMRKGAFWYYLEQINLKPEVFQEKKPVCSQIYDKNKNKLLFEVSYYKNRINLETYHVLTDGTGALSFLKTIVYYYLLAAHGEYFSPNLPALDTDASFSEKEADSFRKYYQRNRKANRINTRRAYNFKYRKQEHLQVIEGIVSAKEVLQAAHEYGTTITVYLTAVFIAAIHKEMTAMSQKRPVIIMVPVNLRKYFPSETARNFFGMIQVSYHFGKNSEEFSDIIKAVDTCFKEELEKNRLAVRMNALSALEHNFLIRIAPLPLKNVALKYARKITDKTETSVLSNIGRVSMPKEMGRYINLFGMLSSTKKLQLGLCSFGDRLQIGFTSAFMHTDIPKNFFRHLTDSAIHTEIRCNDFYAEDDHAILP